MTAKENGIWPGRKRDERRNSEILDAALEILAEKGYEGMTLDAVAARARAGKATMYRRWPSKAHLVHDAIVRLGQRDIDLDNVPDTGSLRGDIEVLTRPDAFGEQRVKVIAGLVSMVGSDRTGLGAMAFAASVAPWVAANGVVLDRAVRRGEIAASADVELLSRLVPSMCMYRVSVERVALTPEFIDGLINRVLLPAVGIAPGPFAPPGREPDTPDETRREHERSDNPSHQLPR